jgi:hypothetical protein
VKSFVIISFPKRVLDFPRTAESVQIVDQSFVGLELNFHGYEAGIKTPLMSSHCTGAPAGTFNNS